MATVEERLAALESELADVKLQLARIGKPRVWLDQVAGSMDRWPEFEEVLRLGQDMRQSERDSSGNAAEQG